MNAATHQRHRGPTSRYRLPVGAAALPPAPYGAPTQCLLPSGSYLRSNADYTLLLRVPQRRHHYARHMPIFQPCYHHMPFYTGGACRSALALMFDLSLTALQYAAPPTLA